MRVPTVTVYKDGKAVIVNESEKQKWFDNGWSDGKQSENHAMKKAELEQIAQERGIDTARMRKAEIIEALNE